MVISPGLDCVWLDTEGEKRGKAGLCLRGARCALLFPQLSLEQIGRGSIFHRMCQIRNGSQLLWPITLNLWWWKESHLSLRHALVPLLFCWGKSQYLTQRAYLASPERWRFPCAHLKKISLAGPGQELSWLQPAHGFSMHRNFLLQYVHSRYLCFPSPPIASQPSLSWTRSPSQWLTLAFITISRAVQAEAENRGGCPRFLKPTFLSPSCVLFWMNGESGSQTLEIGCSRYSGRLYSLLWGFKTLISNRSEKAAGARKLSGTYQALSPEMTTETAAGFPGLCWSIISFPF